MKHQTRINEILYFYDANYDETSEACSNIPEAMIKASIDKMVVVPPAYTVPFEIVIYGEQTPNLPLKSTELESKIKLINGDNIPKIVNMNISQSESEVVIFCESQMSISPPDIYKLLNLLSKGYGIVSLNGFKFFGMRKELVRRIGFMDERVNEFDIIMRLKEADIAYYEDNLNGLIGLNEPIELNTKWALSNGKYYRLSPEPCYDYQLNIYPKLKNVPTNIIFLPWSRTVLPTFANLVSIPLYGYIDIIPVHLRNKPPPLDTFGNNDFLIDFAKWLKPNLYVEFGIKYNPNLAKMATICKTIHGIYPTPNEIGPIENLSIFTQVDQYINTTLNSLDSHYKIDLALINVNYGCEQTFKIFQRIFPYIVEDGFVFVYNTYPFNVLMTQPQFCNDNHLVPNMVKDIYGTKCELVTLPFNPGLTIIKKKINVKPGFLM